MFKARAKLALEKRVGKGAGAADSEGGLRVVLGLVLPRRLVVDGRDVRECDHLWWGRVDRPMQGHGPGAPSGGP